MFFFTRFQGFLNKAKEKKKKELPDPFLSSPLEKTAEHWKSSRNCEMHVHYLCCFLVSYRMFDTGSASAVFYLSRNCHRRAALARFSLEKRNRIPRDFQVTQHGRKIKIKMLPLPPPFLSFSCLPFPFPPLNHCLAICSILE